MVVVRRVKEGPELGPHRQGGNRGCSRQEQHHQRSVVSGALNAKDRKNLDFLPRVLGRHTENGTERGEDSSWTGGKGYTPLARDSSCSQWLGLVTWRAFLGRYPIESWTRWATEGDMDMRGQEGEPEKDLRRKISSKRDEQVRATH